MKRVERFTRGRIWGGRPNGSKPPESIKPGEYGWLGNPYHIDKAGDPEQERARAITCYRDYFLARVQTDSKFREAVLSLRGAAVACCPMKRRCHLDVVAEYLASVIINPEAGERQKLHL